MCIDSKSAGCYMLLPEDTQPLCPTGSTFQQIRNAEATGLSVINTLSSLSERSISVPVEILKKQRTTLPKGGTAFSSVG